MAILKIRYLAIFFFLTLMVISCGKKSNETSDESLSLPYGFQTNDKFCKNESFSIIDIFHDDGTLDQFYDSIDGKDTSNLLELVVNNNKSEFIDFSQNFGNLLSNHSDLISTLLTKNIRNTLNLILDRNSTNLSSIFNYTSNSFSDIQAFYNPNAANILTKHFFSFMDSVSEDKSNSISGGKELLEIGYKITKYILDTKTKNEIRDDIQEYVDTLREIDYNKDFTDLSKVLGKITVQADYPLWIDADNYPVKRQMIDIKSHSNTEIGNTVKGIHTLFTHLNDIMMNEEGRFLIQSLIRETAELFNFSSAENNKELIKELIYNLEDYFTKKGENYEIDPVYHQNDHEIFSDTELGGKLKDIFPLIFHLGLRSDRPDALIQDNEWRKQLYPLYQMANYLKNGLRIDPETANIEKSIYTLLKYDYLGRDRTDPASGAYPLSFLEHAAYTICIANNVGWEDGGNLGEIDQDAADNRKFHNHGKYINALSVNDALFSVRTHSILELPNIGSAFLGLFDLTFHEHDGEHISRSFVPFSRDDMGDHQFYYNQNYGALNCLSGPAVGDAGTPSGGSIEKNSTAQNTINSYRPYDPTGREETNIAVIVATHIMRTCINGEGPFYFSDPDAPTVRINGKDYKKYLRPNGKVYALVNKDQKTWDYLYPTDTGDAEDKWTEKIYGYNGKRERFNRYKSSFTSDYYMVKYPMPLGNIYKTASNKEGNLKIVTVKAGAQAQALQFNELISENNHRRACGSPEEALFRNWNWLWFEKKWSIVLPLYLSINLDDFGLGKGTLALGAAFVNFEANGFAGLGNIRKYEKNHVWAKKGEDGASTIPGDYRVEVEAKFIFDALNALGIVDMISEFLIYDLVFDNGTAVPSYLGRNLPSISRQAFPLSPVMDRGNGIKDKQLGSLEFEVGDDIWENRNAIIPIALSLLGGIYDNTITYPDYNTSEDKKHINQGITNVVNKITDIVIPLVYYQKNKGTSPYNCFKPRINGNNMPQCGNHKGDPFLLSSSEMYDEDNIRLNWNGSEEETFYFLPLSMKTPLNVLIDSDINSAGKRLDGILPTIVTETNILTSFMKLLMCDANDSEKLYSSLEQVLTSTRLTKGEVTKIFEGPDRYGESGFQKNVVYPDWLFVECDESSNDAYGACTNFFKSRQEDFILDNAIDSLIGHDRIDDINDGYGLANYPDDKIAIGDDNWKDFEQTYDFLVNLFHSESPYSVTENIINLTEYLFGNGKKYTDNQLSGFLYCIGRIFSQYDVDREKWAYQGDTGFSDLYNLFASSIPSIHDQLKDNTGHNYQDLLIIISELLKNDGLLHYLNDTIDIEYGWEKILKDIEVFLGQDFFKEPAPLWNTVSSLLNDLSAAIENNVDSSKTELIYKNYGFQMN